MTTPCTEIFRRCLVCLCLFPPLVLGAGLERITLPPGFAIEYYARDVEGARSLALGEKGTVFVGSRGAGKLYALPDAEGDGRADEVRVLARGLDLPNGVAVHRGDLYVAERSRILRFANIEANLHRPPAPEVIYAGLPNESHHGWRYLAAGPDGWLYVSVGAPCNVCARAGYALIARLRPDGSQFEIFAHGVRNSVGFDWHPRSGSLWFSDNGRDWLGDDLPPEEINRAPAPGLHFGFPYCHGGEISDPEFGAGRSCSEFTAPAITLGAHRAPLGVRFYTGEQFPPAYRGQLLVAEHGSWNRSRKVGYRIGWVELEGERAVAYHPFAEGWLEDGQVYGRPVDLLVMPDGALLVSDDMRGAIYRISYQGD